MRCERNGFYKIILILDLFSFEFYPSYMYMNLVLDKTNGK